MKKFLTASLLAAGMLFATACADSPTPSTSAGGATAGGPVKIAYVVKAMSDQFWIDMKAGADKAAAANKVELSFQAPEKETDVEKQIPRRRALSSPSRPPTRKPASNSRSRWSRTRSPRR